MMLQTSDSNKTPDVVISYHPRWERSRKKNVTPQEISAMIGLKKARWKSNQRSWSQFLLTNDAQRRKQLKTTKSLVLERIVNEPTAQQLLCYGLSKTDEKS